MSDNVVKLKEEEQEIAIRLMNEFKLKNVVVIAQDESDEEVVIITGDENVDPPTVNWMLDLAKLHFIGGF